MSTNYKKRITVNFPDRADADAIKWRAKAVGMSPSKWIIRRLIDAELLEELWESTKALKMS